MIDDEEDEYKEFFEKNRKKQVKSGLKAIAVVAVFVLSYYLIQLGFSGGESGMPYTTLGFLLICMLSLLMGIQKPKKKENRQTLSILGCTVDQCPGKIVRDFRDSDYVFKEGGKCPRCSSKMQIEEIYSVKLKDPKTEKDPKIAHKIEIKPRL